MECDTIAILIAVKARQEGSAYDWQPAFVPVDEEHTLLYLRFYQRFLRLPLLGGLVARLAMPFNRLVAHQDRRGVQTQEPKASGRRIGEQLIQGDHPIVAYPRRRQALIEVHSQR